MYTYILYTMYIIYLRGVGVRRTVRVGVRVGVCVYLIFNIYDDYK